MYFEIFWLEKMKGREYVRRSY